MKHRSITTAFAASALFALGSASGASAAPANSQTTNKAEMYAEKRHSVAAVSADADAILKALDRDPVLAARLVKNPAGAEAMLRALGATRAEHIIVTSVGGDGAQRTTITIIIKVDEVTITITIRL